MVTPEGNFSWDLREHDQQISIYNCDFIVRWYDVSHSDITNGRKAQLGSSKASYNKDQTPRLTLADSVAPSRSGALRDVWRCCVTSTVTRSERGTTPLVVIGGLRITGMSQKLMT